MDDARTREAATLVPLLERSEVTIWCLVGKIRNFFINGCTYMDKEITTCNGLH